jgi:drug/metabolite transporter (DMT)-like permease
MFAGFCSQPAVKAGKLCSVRQRPAAGARKPVSSPLLPPAHGAALWAFAGMTLIWGSTWYAIREQLNGTPMFVSVALRFALAAGVLALWMLATRRPLGIPRRLWSLVLVQGLCVCGINYLFAYSATAYIASGLVALVFAFNVVVSLLLEPVLLGRRSPPQLWLAAGLGVAGLALMLLPGEPGVPSPNRLLGVGLALGGAICVGLGNVLSSRLISGGASLFAMNFWGFMVGTVLALLAATLSGDGWKVVWTRDYALSLVYLSVIGSILAFALYLQVVRELGPVRAGYSAVLTPVIALLISGLLEGLRFTPTLVGGLALVLLGNLLVLRQRAQRLAR